MSDLLDTVIEAHGGFSRWNKFTALDAQLKQGGVLWAIKHKAGLLDDVEVTVDLREQRASHRPFGQAWRRSCFTPDWVTIRGLNGGPVEELIDPRSSFSGHALETPWSDLQLAYFAGYAMWTYLNMPFLLAYPGVETLEIEPWREGGQSWRRLRASFPPTIATHSPVQTIFVDARGLLVRHDYDVEIDGGTPAAHYISEYIDVSGIKMPTKRRVFPRQPDGRPMRETLVVSIDLSHIVLR